MTIFPRDRYLNQLTSFHGSELVRVITGMRRSGKSSLLKLYRDWLISEKKIEEKNIVYINFESLKYSNLSPSMIMSVDSLLKPEQKCICFLTRFKTLRSGRRP
jgi:predicted AAA+ superfamily ATPase